MPLWTYVTNAFGNDDSYNWKTTAKVVGAMVGIGVLGYGAYRMFYGLPTSGPMDAASPIPQSRAIETPEEKLQMALRYKEQGNQKYLASQYQEAKKLYTDAILMCPSDAQDKLAVFYQNRAATSDALEQWELVIQDCDEAIARDARYQKAYSRRGKAKLALQQYDDAVSDTASGYYLQSKKKTKQNVQLFMQAVSESSRIKSAMVLENRPGPLNFGMEVVRSYIANSPSDPVICKLEEYAKVEEAERRPFHRACIKVLAADSSAAIVADLDEEIQLTDSPFYAKSLLLRATVFSIGGCPDRAEKDLQTLISIDTLTPRLRSSAYLRRGLHHVTTDAALGLKDLEKAIEADPTNPDVYHQRAQILMLMQSLSQAKADFETAHNLHMKAAGTGNIHIIIHKLTCDLHSGHGNQLEIIGQMKDMCDNHPTISELWLIYGQTLMFFGQYPDADRAYESSLKHCPDNPKILIQRAALMLSWKRDRALAIEYLNKAKSLDRNCDAVYESLGAVLVQDDQLEEAVEIFEQQVKTARTLIECQQAYCMLESVKAQVFVAEKFQLKNLANLFLSPQPVPS